MSCTMSADDGFFDGLVFGSIQSRIPALSFREGSLEQYVLQASPSRGLFFRKLTCGRSLHQAHQASQGYVALPGTRILQIIHTLTMSMFGSMLMVLRKQ